MYHNLEVHDEILYHTMVGGVSWIDSTNLNTCKGVLLGQKNATNKGEAFHNFSWTPLGLTKLFISPLSFSVGYAYTRIREIVGRKPE